MADLPINSSASAMDMANSMFGSGITVSSATISGASTQSGIFSNGDTIAPGATPSDTGVILSTGNVQDYTNASGDVNVASDTSTNYNGAGDAGLDSLTGSGYASQDAVVFEANFVPVGEILKLDLMFASEEYLEYIGDIYEDAIGVWINGVYAPVENISGGIININTVNDTTNSAYFIDNTGDAVNTEMDGLTAPLTISGAVNPGVSNTIRIVIADVGDGLLDSAILISGDSVVSVCFAKGTRILTPGGPTPIEDLAPGDLVCTLDNGPRPLRWIGRSRLPNSGGLGPVCFPPGAFGNARPLHVSQQHRILLHSARAEVLFDTHQVLVAAKHLASDRNAHIPQTGRTLFYHLLLDRHELITAEGVLCESLYVGNMALIGMSRRTIADLKRQVPHLGTETAPLARRTLRKYEYDALKRFQRNLTARAPPEPPASSPRKPRRPSR